MPPGDIPLPDTLDDWETSRRSPIETSDFAAWLDLDPLPVLLIGAGGMLLEASRSGRQLLERGAAVSLRNSTICFFDARSQETFLRALTSVISRRTLNSKIIVRGTDGTWRRVDLVGCGPNGREQAFMRFATEPLSAFDIEAVMQAFGLSGAESEVLRRLVEGLAPKEIADTLSTSPNAVRSHLRLLYLKMNVRGIAGLIRHTVRLSRP
jgi:DNA-binding CsgD family transcriptional regulator